MAEFRQLMITNKGQALMAKLIAGSTVIEFSRIATSASVYTDEELLELVVVEEKQSTLISGITRTNEVAVEIEGALTNEELKEGYFLNALVLYAIDPEEGEIIYGACGASTAGYMPPFNQVDYKWCFV